MEIADDDFEFKEPDQEDENINKPTIIGKDNANFKKFDVKEIYKHINDKEDEPLLTQESITKFEITRCIGVRAQQINSGAPPLTNFEGSPIDIATRELKDGKLPFIIMRTLPNGETEYIPLRRLIISPFLMQCVE